MFVVGGMIVSFITAIPVVALGFDKNLGVSLVRSLLCGWVGMWVARRATDRVVRTYSGRVVFVVFLSLTLVLGTAAAMVVPITSKTATDFASLIATPVFAYLLFWRRNHLIESSPLAEPIEVERRGLPGLWDSVAPVLAMLPGVLWLVYGLAQLAAVSAQISSFLHFNGFFSTFLALGLTYVPVVGGLIGFFGAKDVWGWVWWQAALLCFGPFIFIAALMAVTSIGAAGAAALQGARRRVR